jgi:outer membrane protein assembly factor BamA
LPVAPGHVAVRDEILAGTQVAEAALKNEGYAYAAVDLQQDTVSPQRVRVRYRAAPGLQAYFGPVDVVGNSSVSDNVVRRQLTYRPGELFRLDTLRAAQRQLYSLELFQFAAIDSLDSGEPMELRTRVTVAEGDHRRLRFSVGWGTEEKLRGEASWRHVNFYGGARVLAGGLVRAVHQLISCCTAP